MAWLFVRLYVGYVSVWQWFGNALAMFSAMHWQCIGNELAMSRLCNSMLTLRSFVIATAVLNVVLDNAFSIVRQP